MGVTPQRAPFLAVGSVTFALAFAFAPMVNQPAQSVGAQTPVEVTTGHAAASAVAGTYVPLSPSRITDTRLGSNYPNAGSTLGSGTSLNVQVAGVGGVPVSGISAVVLNITVVNPTASSFLTVFPEGTSQPVVSNLDFAAAETLANLVTVAVGSQGGVTIYNHVGNANVVADVEGYYTVTPLSTGLYDPVNPLRVLGTAASGITVGAGTSTPVKVAGVDGVPVDASAVVANVTVAGSSTAGYLTVFPAPNSGAPTPPGASALNFAPGQVTANRIIIPVGSAGQIDVYNYTGSVKVDLDLNGYYTGSSGELGGAFTPLSPVRFVDTRVGTNGTPTSPNSKEDFSFLSEGISVTAIALASNMTVVAGAGAGYMSVYPATTSSPPAVSDANYLANSVVQNFTLAPLDQGNVSVFNSSAAPINIVIDAFGYFAPPPTATHLVANPTSLPADGMSTSTVTATVTTGSGIAFDDPITMSTTPSIPGSCGAVSATGSTNASGQVTSTYTSSTTAGTCTVTATEANGGTQGSVVITQT